MLGVYWNEGRWYLVTSTERRVITEVSEARLRVCRVGVRLRKIPVTANTRKLRRVTPRPMQVFHGAAKVSRKSTLPTPSCLSTFAFVCGACVFVSIRSEQYIKLRF